MTVLTVYNLKGEKSGTFKVGTAFEGRPNLRLLSQAVHVRLSNKRRGLARAMTRGLSGRTTAKWYRQKHTGRARHGAKSAPIFVGGGVAHGPTGEQNYHRSLPRKMLRKALEAALLAKVKRDELLIVGGMEKLAPRTKEAQRLLAALKLTGKKVLLASEKKEVNLCRAVGNLPEVSVTLAENLNAYDVLVNRAVVLTPEAAERQLGAKGEKKGKK